jgi:hypothetical protein
MEEVPVPGLRCAYPVRRGVFVGSGGSFAVQVERLRVCACVRCDVGALGAAEGVEDVVDAGVDDDAGRLATFGGAGVG